MAVQAYLFFNGNCREAVTFYSKVFGTEEPRIMVFGDAPPNENFPMDEETKQRVMHTNLSIFGSLVMFSDAMPAQPVTIGDNFSLTITTGDEDALRKSFPLLAEGGTITQELTETFFSKCYGAVIDQFGISWQFTLQGE